MRTTEVKSIANYVSPRTATLLEELLEECQNIKALIAVRRLDPIIANTFRDNPVVMAAWQSVFSVNYISRSYCLIVVDQQILSFIEPGYSGRERGR